MPESNLMWLDYLIFCLMLSISLGIGIYHAFTGGKQRTTSEYLLGNRSMGIVPVTISLMVTQSSALTLLGFPSEIYAYGSQWFLAIAAYTVGAIASVFLFLPVLYPLQATSVNEYLLQRYESKVILYTGSIFTVLAMVFWIGNATYMPATAIEAVSGIPAWISITVTSLITIIYSSIGGFKAVVWTDVFQSVFMYAGVFIVLVKSVLAIGGFSSMVKYNQDWGRLTFFDFDPDPTKRLNFYGVFFGNGLSAVAIYGYSQVGFQRYSSISSISRARKLLFSMVPGIMVMQVMSCLCGITVFAYYAMQGCDPKAGGKITSYNQIVAYFVSDAMAIPGIPGLFIAAVYAASLSSASSALNSSAACAWRDMLKDFFPGISEQRAALINKIITFVLGMTGLGLAIAVDNAGGTVIQIGNTFSAATTGPLGALFFMGIFIPWVNWKGASVGCVIAVGFGAWISVGSYLHGKHWGALPVPSANCSLGINFTNDSMTYAGEKTSMGPYSTAVPVDDELEGIYRLYNLSFTWMREVVTGVAIFFSILFSWITGFNKTTDMEGRLVHPILRRCFKFKENQSNGNVIEPHEKEKFIENTVM